VLLVVLAVIVFACLNFYGYRWLSQKQAALRLSEASLRADQAEAEVDLQQAALWQKNMAWINDHQPPLSDEGDAKAQLLEYVLKGARDNKLEVQEQNLNDTQHTLGGTQINVSVKVKGSMQDLVKWLTALEVPDQFYAVSLFSLKADQDQKSFICSLQFARYYKNGT
jgi:hypothetical protein